MLQVVEHKGQWVALLDWGPATWKLADREEWIGWPPQQKSVRLGLEAMPVSNSNGCREDFKFGGACLIGIVD